MAVRFDPSLCSRSEELDGLAYGSATADAQGVRRQEDMYVGRAELIASPASDFFLSPPSFSSLVRKAVLGMMAVRRMTGAAAAVSQLAQDVAQSKEDAARVCPFHPELRSLS